MPPEGGFGFSAAELEAELGRILSSHCFAHAESISRLMRILVERALRGDREGLKETALGVEVFGRKPGYNPQVDPIVRVSARRLRTKLQEYYRGEGKYDPCRIDLPKGGYVIEFRHREISARGTRLVTNHPGHHDHPAFSPDGQAISFDWRVAGDIPESIYVQSFDADSPARFTRHITRELRPAWAPDGGHIACVRETAKGRFSVQVIPVFGSGDRMLAKISVGTEDLPRVDWSPDGEFLVTEERISNEAPSHLILISANTGERRQISKPPPQSRGDDEAVFSPKGNLVAFRRRFGLSVEDIYLVSTEEGGEARRLTLDNCGISGLAWAADGDSVIVSSRRAGTVQGLWRFPLSGDSPERLIEVKEAVLSPAMSRRGDRLAYVSCPLSVSIWRMGAAEGTPVHALIDSMGCDWSPQYSPDGRQIAFCSNRSGSDEIWVSDGEGHFPHRVTSLGGPLVDHPRWSPDGRHLAFDSHLGGTSNIYIVPFEGGTPLRLTEESSSEKYPSWSGDGQFVYFASDRSGSWQIWKQPTSGGPAIAVTCNGGAMGFESPDRQFLYFCKGDGARGIWRVPLSGGQEELVTGDLASDMWENWAVGPSGIYYAEPDREGRFAVTIRRFDSARGLNCNVGNLPAIPTGGNGGLSVSPDGQSVLCALRGNYDSQIVLVDGFE